MTEGPLWTAARYQEFGRFVSEEGRLILDWLDPQRGERILDAGCGDGALTVELMKRGADVVGIERAPNMVEAAREAGVDVREMDLLALDERAAYEAIFSNAVLHWIEEWPALLGCFYQALRPKGRLVVECGGFGNIAAIRTAIRAVAVRQGVETKATGERYLTTDEASVLLQEAGFEVKRLELVPRPTLLEKGLAGWLRVFREPFLLQFMEGPHRDEVIEEVLGLLQPVLQTPQGVWYADYVRLRFVAVKN